MGKRFFNILATFAEFEVDLCASGHGRAWPWPGRKGACGGVNRNSHPNNDPSCAACTPAATTRSPTSPSCSPCPAQRVPDPPSSHPKRQITLNLHRQIALKVTAHEVVVDVWLGHTPTNQTLQDHPAVGSSVVLVVLIHKGLGFFSPCGAGVRVGVVAGHLVRV